MEYKNHIDGYDTDVSLHIQKNIYGTPRKQIDEILALVHILIAVAVSEDETILKLLLDTLVGLGLTITDGRRLVEELLKDICKGHET